MSFSWLGSFVGFGTAGSLCFSLRFFCFSNGVHGNQP